MAKYTKEAGDRSGREQQLELALIQAQSERSLLELDVAGLKESHAAELRDQAAAHKAGVRAMKVRVRGTRKGSHAQPTPVCAQ